MDSVFGRLVDSFAVDEGARTFSEKIDVVKEEEESIENDPFQGFTVKLKNRLRSYVREILAASSIGDGFEPSEHGAFPVSGDFVEGIYAFSPNPEDSGVPIEEEEFEDDDSLRAILDERLRLKVVPPVEDAFGGGGDDRPTIKFFFI